MREAISRVIARSTVPFVLGAVLSALLVRGLISGESAEFPAAENSVMAELRPVEDASRLTALKRSGEDAVATGVDNPNSADAVEVDPRALTGKQWMQRYKIMRRGWIRANLRIDELEEEARILNGGEPEVDPALEAALAERERLASAPAIQMKVERAPIFDVIRFLFEESGVSYLMPVNPNPDATTLITYDWDDTSPFTGLEIVARNNGYNLIRDHGVWTLESMDDQWAKQAAQWIEGYERTMGRPATEEEFNGLTDPPSYLVNAALR